MPTVVNAHGHRELPGRLRLDLGPGVPGPSHKATAADRLCNPTKCGPAGARPLVDSPPADLAGTDFLAPGELRRYRQIAGGAVPLRPVGQDARCTIRDRRPGCPAGGIGARPGEPAGTRATAQPVPDPSMPGGMTAWLLRIVRHATTPSYSEARTCSVSGTVRDQQATAVFTGIQGWRVGRPGRTAAQSS